MNIFFTRQADRDYDDLPPAIQARVDKQLDLLAANLRHPSIRAKKYDESRDIWQGRVTQSYRFYFKIDGDTYTIIAIVRHPK